MIEVVCDRREVRSGVPLAVEKLGSMVDIETLEIGDYCVSDRVVIERKTVSDFLTSVIENRQHLFTQIKDMRREYSRPLLIMEGSPTDLYISRAIHPNAIDAMLEAIGIDYGVPIMWSLSSEHTAQIIYRAAVREQTDHKRTISLHGSRSKMSPQRQVLYIVSAFPDLGPTIATNLLEHFGSIQNIINATEDELKTVDKVGPKTAKIVQEVSRRQYQ
jgi:Fanconi anemia group M protein